MSLLDRVALAIATLAGAGYAPVAPGTIGSLITLILLWWWSPSPITLVIAVVVITLLGIWAGGRTETLIGKKDPGQVVIDEVAGMMLSVLFLPFTHATFIAAFLLFRLFDIVKPYPARQWQAWPGGIGIMVDDLMAGVYANILIHLSRELVDFP
ncbi:MAG TPA: phosphatidylglycerophosphatase A [Methylomirabilota bacterium]|nr:phosphatidylglycerophosphatase A [Methylomirabilota bacterium]